MKTEQKSKFFRTLGERPTYGTESGRLKALISVSFLHFLNDLHPTLLPTFLPEIVKRLSLSLGQAGFLSTLFGILNLLIQPVAGHFADRCNRPSFALWAPLLTAGGAYLLPIAPNYGVAMLFVCLMGIGTASYHPQGHGLTGLSGGERNLGTYLAVFAAAGTFGSAVSSLYGVFLIKHLGANLIPFALVPVLGLVLVARFFLPATSCEPGDAEENAEQKSAGSTSRSKENFFESTFRILTICLPLILIAIVRDSTSQGIRVFLPLLVTGRGESLSLGGYVLFAYTLAGSIANLAGGKLADLFGKKRIITIMLVLAPLFLFPAIWMDGLLSIALFMLGGACISATNPVTLAMAQERVPGARSTASSLVMGVSWGIANIVASPIGMLADRIGLTAALAIVALSPFLVVAGLFGEYIVHRGRSA